MKTPFRHRSIRAQIFALVLAIALPFTAMLTWFLADNLEHARSAAQSEVQILADDAAADLQRFLRQSQITLGRLAERPLVKGLDSRHCDPVFSDYVRLNPDFITLGLRDNQANAICSFQLNPPSGSLIARMPWFTESVGSKRLMMSDAFVGPTSGRWVTVLTHPVQSDTDKPDGLLALTVDLEKLSQDVLEPIPKNATVQVFDRHLTTVLRTGNSALAIGDRAPSPVHEFVKNGGKGFMTVTDTDGVAHLNALVTLPGVEWRVMAGLPEAEVLANYYSTRRTAIGLGLAVLVAVSLMAWRIGAAIVKPIAQLADTVTQIENGDKTARAQISGPTEIRAVTQQFNQMLDAHDRSKNALQESERRYQALVEWSPEAVIVHGAGKVLYVNPSAIKMLGATSAKELVGKLVFDLQLLKLDPRKQIGTQQFIDASSEGITETTMRRSDGAAIDIEAQSTLIVYDGTHAVHTSMHDITARKQVKAELIATKDMLQATLDAIPDLLFEVGLDGHIFAYHYHRSDLLAVSPEVFLGKKFSEILPPEASDICLAAVQEAAQQGWSSGASYALQLPQGERWFELSISEMPPNATKDRHFIILSRDITKRKLTESRLEELSRRLVQTQEETRRRFSHELHDRTSPNLAALRINLDIVANSLPQAYETQEFADRIEDTRALIDDTTISIRQICAELHPPALDRGGLLGVVQSYAQQFAKRSGLKVQVHCSHGDVRLETDLELGLFRIVQEAMTNCAKHAKASKIEVNLQFDGSPKRISISDDGVGFDNDPLETAVLRAGLGLLNMKETAEFAGGSFRIESDPGYGTQIYVEV